MSKYSRLGKNTILVFVGNIGSKLIGFLMLPFYTKWLSVSDYGTTDMIGIYVSFLLGIVTLCLSESIFIFPKDQDQRTQSKYFSSALSICIASYVLTAVIFYLIQYILDILDITNTFTEYTWIIYALLLTTSIQFFLQQFARSLDKVGIYATSGVILTLSTAVASFILIPQYGLTGYFAAQIGAQIITSLYAYIVSKSYNYTSIKAISHKAYKEMLKYSIPLIPNGIMWWMISAINRPVTESYLGLKEVGIFAVANKFPAVMMILFSIFSYSWQISVLEEYKKEGYHKFYNRMVFLVFSALILISCAFAICSPFLIKIVDAKFVDAVHYIPILSLGVVFSSFSAMIGVNFSAVRQSKYYFYSSIWGALGSAILSLILIPYFKLYGACLAIVIPHLIMAITRLHYSWKYVKLDNIHKYALLVTINVALIATISMCGINIMSSILIITLFVFYVFLNKDLIKDVVIKYNQRK